MSKIKHVLTVIIKSKHFLI
jgi:hypothetical protein